MATQGAGPLEGFEDHPLNRIDDDLENMSALEFTFLMAIAIPVLFVKGVAKTGRNIIRRLSGGNDQKDSSS